MGQIHTGKKMRGNLQSRELSEAVKQFQFEKKEEGSLEFEIVLKKIFLFSSDSRQSCDDSN